MLEAVLILIGLAALSRAWNFSITFIPNFVLPLFSPRHMPLYACHMLSAVVLLFAIVLIIC